jgi:hypothetical protein
VVILFSKGLLCVKTHNTVQERSLFRHCLTERESIGGDRLSFKGGRHGRRKGHTPPERHLKTHQGAQQDPEGQDQTRQGEKENRKMSFKNILFIAALP